jgi:hypothetical protein
MGKGTTDTQEEAGSDGTSKGNELNVSRFKASSNIAIFFGGLDITKDVRGLVHFGSSSGLRRRSVRLKG